jgi:hypothetical protein
LSGLDSFAEQRDGWAGVVGWPVGWPPCHTRQVQVLSTGCEVRSARADEVVSSVPQGVGSGLDSFAEQREGWVKSGNSDRTENLIRTTEIRVHVIGSHRKKDPYKDMYKLAEICQ